MENVMAEEEMANVTARIFSGLHLVTWRWKHVGVYVAFPFFIVLSGLAKIGFHHARFLSSRMPESCLLVMTGLAMGTLIKFVGNDEDGDALAFPKFTPTLFFYFLLPPIILESAYSLYDKAFFDNLSTVLVMAVVGTFINFVLLSSSLWLVSLWLFSSEVSLLEVCVFASLISAVDPVAVLAIFQEVGVNPDLYFLVFGESLLNDGVAVVLYNLLNAMSASSSFSSSYLMLGPASFVSVTVGGLSIGVILGLITAVVTKTTREVRVVEPLAVFGLAYLSYATAELFHWSGIISLIGCGLLQAHYAFKNISRKSYTTVKYFMKMLSATSDSVIFLFLGLAVVEGEHEWNSVFVVATLTLSLVVRFISVYGLIWLCNRRRVKKINVQEQFIMAYGGLRGAVGFSLVAMIDEEVVGAKRMFETTTLATILFTIFFQGGTIKWLVDLLNIDRKKSEDRLLSVQVNDSVTDHVMAGIEIISGKRGSQYILQVLERYDETLMKWLCNRSRFCELTNLYEKLAISDHLCNLYGPSALLEAGNLGVDGIDLNIEETEDDDDDHDLEDDQDKWNGIEEALPMMDLTDYPSDGVRVAAGKSRLAPTHSPLSAKSSTTSLPRSKQVELLARSGSARRSSCRRASWMRTHNAQVSFDGKTDNNKDDIDQLTKALRDTPYNKFHRKYNRNLIEDDAQELETHLRLRHLNARRFSQLAMRIRESSFDSGSTHEVVSTSDEHLLHEVPRVERAGVAAILMQHEKRMRSMSLGATRNSPSSEATHRHFQAKESMLTRSTTVPNKRWSRRRPLINPSGEQLNHIDEEEANRPTDQSNKLPL